ncbi:MAG: hypothetical protein QM731_19765 [Chitinophagaceae bacterium]
MKNFKIAVLLLGCLSVAILGYSQDKFNHSAFYAAMAGDELKDVESQLKAIEGIEGNERDAYEGTLLMKKAGLVGGPAKKLNLFKAGHKKLEGVIEKDSANAEYRFLRLMIQENAPGILGYKSDLEKDKQYIRTHFKSLSAIVQQAVLNYSKKSKVLQSTDLNGA